MTCYVIVLDPSVKNDCQTGNFSHMQIKEVGHCYHSFLSKEVFNVDWCMGLGLPRAKRCVTLALEEGGMLHVADFD